MSIPLIQKPDKDDINTSIIAIKRNIERINMLLGLSNSEEIDTSKFATKDELQQAVTDLQPVDEVTVGNMQSVTSNAVSKALSYSTTEHKTGKKWIDGKDTWQAVVENITVTTNWGVITAIGNVVDSLINVIPVLTAGNVVTNVQRKVDNNYIYIAKSSSDIVESTKFIFEYTKITD